MRKFVGYLPLYDSGPITAQAIFRSQARASLSQKPRIFFNHLFGYWKVMHPTYKAEIYCHNFRVACKLARNIGGLT